MTAARPVARVLLSAAGLAVWGGHFTAIYAFTALACERGLIGRLILGLPAVPAMVGLATVLALLLLALLVRPALSARQVGTREAAETEPDFTRWFAAATALLAALAVLFQALPALLLPGCA
jgi:multidrug efflux pump subunit AcrB